MGHPDSNQNQNQNNRNKRPFNFRDTWPTIIGWMLYVGVTYGIYTTNNKWIESRISKIEQLNPEETKYKVTDLSNRTLNLETDGKVQQQNIADLKAKIDVINTKLDTITDLLKRGTQK